MHLKPCKCHWRRFEKFLVLLVTVLSWEGLAEDEGGRV